MFRLDVSHLQAPKLTLPDALSTLGTHSVYIHIHSVEQDQPQGMKNRVTTKYTYRQKNLKENSTQHHRANTPNCNVTKASHSWTYSEHQRTI